MSHTSLPNVVLICADQWRGDCLGVENHPCVDTPYLDMYANSGCRFQRAYAASPSCIPARAALYTGLSQKTNRRVGYLDEVDWDYSTTIASVFGQNGYQTHAVGKMHVHPPRNRMGFDSVELHDGYLHCNRNRTKYDLEMNDDYLPWLRQRAGADADYLDQCTLCNAYTPHPWDKAETLHPTAWITTRGADFLRRRDTTCPFFLMLSYHRPHPPLDPPLWAYQQYLQSDIPKPLLGDWEEKLLADIYDNTLWFGPKRWSWDRIRRARAAYYAQITFIDHQIQRFINLLEEYGHLGNTIFCFTSDHGDCIGDHTCYAKSVSYESSTRVPLLLFSPNAEFIPRHIVDDEHIVELRDIMPTLLDAAGLEIPDSVEGKSLMRLLRDKNEPWRDYLHGEHECYFGDIGSMHYILTREFKYIWHSGTGREQFFDMLEDPYELHDLAVSDVNSPKMHPFRQILIKELAGREEGFVKNGELVAGRKCVAVLAKKR